MGKRQPVRKILVVRADRIGDLVLSFPAIRILSGTGIRVSLLARAENREVARLAPGVDEVIEWEGAGLAQIVRRLRAGCFDAAIFLQLRASLTIAAFLARIPLRVGPASHADQLLLTDRIVQRRHRSVRSEAEYNLEVASLAVRRLGMESVPLARSPAGVALPGEADTRALEWLAGAAGSAGCAGARLVGIHPGSGGSARNWRPERYASLGRAIESAGLARVVVTGGPGEEALVSSVAGGIGPRCPTYVGTPGGLAEAWALFARLDALVSGSTGPMHLASAAGTPVVALFCPVIACSPVRWGAVGPGRAVNLVPDVPPCERCTGARCRFFDCMDRVRIEDMLGALARALGTAGPRREMERGALAGRMAGGSRVDTGSGSAREPRLPAGRERAA